MSLNYNEAILGGRLTADPELKTTASGISVTSFTLAVDRPRAKDSTENKADFISCVAWKQTAEFITKYFKKGSSLFVTGQIQTRSWTDQNNQKRYVTEVNVEKARFVDSKAASQAPATPATPVDPSYMPESYTQPQPNFVDMAEDEELPF